MSFFGSNQGNNDQPNYHPPKIPIMSSSSGREEEFDPFASLADPSSQQSFPPASSFTLPAADATVHAYAPYGTSSNAISPYSPSPFDNAATTVDPSVNGMFLGLDSHQHSTQSPSVATDHAANGDFMMEQTSLPTENETEEDRELVQAQEAALYAEELLKKQAEEKQKTFGFRPKVPGLPKVPALNWGNKKKDPRKEQEAIKNYQEDYGDEDVTIQVDTSAYEVNRPWYEKQEVEEDTFQRNNKETRPPWFKKQLSDDTPEPSSSRTDDSKGPGGAAAVMGAATLGGVAGLVTLGPLAAVVAAGGVAIQAARAKDDSILRGTGRAVATAGSAAKKFEDKTGVAKKTASGLVKGVGWAISAASSGGKAS